MKNMRNTEWANIIYDLWKWRSDSEGRCWCLLVMAVGVGGWQWGCNWPSSEGFIIYYYGSYCQVQVQAGSRCRRRTQSSPRFGEFNHSQRQNGLKTKRATGGWKNKNPKFRKVSSIKVQTKANLQKGWKIHRQSTNKIIHSSQENTKHPQAQVSNVSTHTLPTVKNPTLVDCHPCP